MRYYSLLCRVEKLVNGRKFVQPILAIIIVTASFLILRIAQAPLTNVSAIGTMGVSVYFDQGFTTEATSIAWGELSPGQTKSVVVYVRNDGTNNTYLDVASVNWNPTNASQYLRLDWNCTTAKISRAKAIKVTASLTVSVDIHAINNFSFDINFRAMSTLPNWDTNRDLKVNLLDLITVARALNASPGSPNWNASADINGDGKVSLIDLIIVESHSGLNYT